MNERVLLTVASWEERFLLGIEKLLSSVKPSVLVMFYLDGVYAGWTQENREKVEELCGRLRVRLASTMLSVEDSEKNWRAVERDLIANVPKGAHVTVHISTMPRDIIWSCFWMLDHLVVRTDYVYHRPDRYGDWLSRDPQRPRLLYKMSGICRIGAPTALLVQLGVDFERAYQLINFYEPSLLLLGVQSPSVHKSLAETARKYAACFRRDLPSQDFEVDAFGTDHGESAIETKVVPLLQSHNVIMSSLGPKPSAIALYRLNRKYPDISLAYAPSKEFNRNYSTGIGEVFAGRVWGDA
jgi:hypothetical protein